VFVVLQSEKELYNVIYFAYARHIRKKGYREKRNHTNKKVVLYIRQALFLLNVI